MLINVPIKEWIVQPELHDHLYVCTIDHALEDSQGFLCIVESVYEELNAVEGLLSIGIYGRNMFGQLGHWKSTTLYLAQDYTQHMKHAIAATRIQRCWRHYRRNTAAKKIQKAFRNWKFRKETLWNPNTLYGLFNMAIQYKTWCTEDDYKL